MKDDFPIMSRLKSRTRDLISRVNAQPVGGKERKYASLGESKEGSEEGGRWGSREARRGERESDDWQGRAVCKEG